MTAGTRCIAILLLLAAAGAAAADDPPPRRLLVQVRDTPPGGAAAIVHGADGSYSVSTGGVGERDERPGAAAGNAASVSTASAVRRLHILEGERVRVDLPAVQSLQFHLPAAGGTGGAGTGAGNAAAAPSASGVVTYEAIAAFAARFALAGSTVRIELTPLRAGTVSAPYAAAAPAGQQTVTVAGRVGEWIALGDTELPEPGTRLNATADPPRAASVWVRVEPEPAGAPR